MYILKKDIARDLAKYFEKITNIKKPQLKLSIHYIGMIETEAVVTNDIVKKLKRDFSLVNLFSTEDD